MNYEFVNREVTSPELSQNPHYRAWLEASERGFHCKRPDDSFVETQLRIEAENRSTLRGAFTTVTHEHALPGDDPVATFVHWDGSLNIGGALIDVRQISDVSVRASQRRRGLLRTLMTGALDDAVDRKLPIAALTATEATIYGRFGFGPAVFHASIELSSNPSFALTIPTAGMVDYLDLDDLDAVAESVFAQFHADQTGSVMRTPTMRKVYTGLLTTDTREPNKKLRAAAHWNNDGSIDGYITWTTEEDAARAIVTDLIGTNEAAMLALWEFVASLDLIKKVEARHVRHDDPLPWALVDRRWYKVQRTYDVLWLRVLDPAACLETRDYVHDGTVSFTVVDELGYAAGSYALSVADQRATVTPATQADMEVDVAALGSAMLGGVRASALQAAGLIRGEQRAIDMFESLLSRRRAPWCPSPF